MIKKIILILTMLALTSVIAQENDQYLVSSKTLNVRNTPTKESKIIAVLNQNESVSVLEIARNGWWKIEFDGGSGYVSSELLKLSSDNGWNKNKYESGQTPNCDNIDSQFDYKIDNSLKVSVGSGSDDVVIKLMKTRSNDKDICIRIIYIRSGEVYSFKNIPEGIYYLKIAYGKDWRQKIVDNQCYGKFMRNAIYEIGSEKLDYVIIHKSNGHISIPYYELSLDRVSLSRYEKKPKSTFATRNIGESRFNQ
jgi:hypothetical protein